MNSNDIKTVFTTDATEAERFSPELAKSFCDEVDGDWKMVSAGKDDNGDRVWLIRNRAMKFIKHSEYQYMNQRK